MKKSLLIAAAFAATTLGASLMPANALPLSAPTAVHETAQNGALTEVRWHHRGHWRHRGWHRGYHHGWRHRHWRHRHWR